VQNIKRITSYIVRFYWGSGISSDVPALSYFFLISLAPFLLGVTSISTLVSSPDSLLSSITGRATSNLPPDLRDAITSIIHQTHIDSPWLLALALFGCLWTCSGAVGVIARCSNRLLKREPLPASLGRIHEMFLAGGVVILVVVLMAVGATAGGAIRNWHLPLDNWIVPLAAWLVTLICLVMLFVSAPRGGMKISAALIGALPASLFLQAVPAIVGLYVSNVASVNVAKIFFLLVIMVIACSLSAQSVLISTGIACNWHKRRESAQNKSVEESKIQE